MKHKLFITALLFFGFCATNSFAQTTPTSPSAQAKTPPVVKKYKAPTKKWAPRAQPAANTATAPRIDTAKNTDFSLNGQYQFLLSRSRNINGYKLINPFRLNGVWKSVTDTLAKGRAELTKSNAKMAELNKTIDTLRRQIKDNETLVTNTNGKIDEINFLGISFTKGTYNAIVWSMIAVLAISLFIVIARSTKNILEAKHRTQLYEEITAEFQNYKAKATEKERKLARELQDERNLIEEMKNSKKS